MKVGKWLTVALALILSPLATQLALAWPQSGGSQPQQPAPAQQPEKKKAKKVWTNEDFRESPAASTSAPAAGSTGASEATAAQKSGKAAKPAEGEAEETAPDDQESVEALEKQLVQLESSHTSYEQQIEDLRKKLRGETSEVLQQVDRDNIRDLETIVSQNEEETAALKAKIEEARKKAAKKKPAPKKAAPPPAETPSPQPE